MRPVLPGDVSAAACVLLALPPPARGRVLDDMLDDAERADRWYRHHGRPHRTLGNGSLMAAALMRDRARERFWDDPDYAACLAMVCFALARRGAQHAENRAVPGA